MNEEKITKEGFEHESERKMPKGETGKNKLGKMFHRWN
jgi:hypothetical protein